MKHLSLLGSLFLIFSCTNPAEKQVPKPASKRTAEMRASKRFEIQITENCENSFGYQILDKGKVIIDQRTIPSVPGTNGFYTRERAQRAGELVLSKMEKGVFPPTVSAEELDSLGVL